MKTQIAKEILRQLGGNKFLAMTGAKDLCYGNDYNLRMKLPKNQSKANRLEITLNENDLYTMRFYHKRDFRADPKTATFTEEKITEVKTLEDIYFDNLQSVFTDVTGMYTSL